MTQYFTGDPFTVNIDPGVAPVLGDIDWSVAAALVAAGASPVVLMAVGFPSEIVNKTLESNRERLRQRRARGSARRRRVFASSLWDWGLYVVATLTCLWLTSSGLFYGGGSARSIAVGFTAVLAVVLLYEVPKSLAQVGSSLPSLRTWRAVPAGLALAIALAGISRLGNLFPPYVYGLVISPRSVAASPRRRAYAVIAGAMSLLGALLICWVVYSQSTASLVRTGWLGEWLSTFVLSALQAIAFALIPATFLDGAEIFQYRRSLWALVHMPVIVFYIWTMFSGAPDWWGATSDIVASAALLVAFGILSILTWSYFRLGRPSARPEAMTSWSSPPSTTVEIDVWEGEGGSIIADPVTEPKDLTTTKTMGAFRPAIISFGAVVVAAVIAVVAADSPSDVAPKTEAGPGVRPAAKLPAGEILPPKHGEAWALSVRSKTTYGPELQPYLTKEELKWRDSFLTGDLVVLPCLKNCSFRVQDFTVRTESRASEASRAGISGAAFVKKGTFYIAAWSKQVVDDCGNNSQATRNLQYQLKLTPAFAGPDDFGAKIHVSGQEKASATWSTDRSCYFPESIKYYEGTGTRTQ